MADGLRINEAEKNLAKKRQSPRSKSGLRVNRAEADLADSGSRYNMDRLQSIKSVAGSGGLRINNAEMEQIKKKLPKP